MPLVDMLSGGVAGLAFHPPAVRFDCEYGGYLIRGMVPNTPGDYFFARHQRSGVVAVRGPLGNLTPGAVYSIIDFEAPLSGVDKYVLMHRTNSQDYIEAPVPPFTCENKHYLRSVFDPWRVSADFCLGEINEVDYKPRVGVHTVLGRRDPVVIVDAQETTRGTLRFISQNRGQLDMLKRLLAYEIEPLLLTIDPDYDLGSSGVLYFMPLEVRDRWVLSDARIPKHVLEVSFVEVSRPPLTETMVDLRPDPSPDAPVIPGIPSAPGAPGASPIPAGAITFAHVKAAYKSFNELQLSGKDFFETLFGKKPSS